MIGSRVVCQERAWLVTGLLPSGGIRLEGAPGMLIVGADEPLSIVDNPIADWPSLVLPTRGGQIQSIKLHGQELHFISDWVKLDPFQMGGALYVNPALNLSFRTRLVLTYAAGDRLTSIGLDVPRSFIPMRQRIERLNVSADGSDDSTKDPLYQSLQEDDL